MDGFATSWLPVVTSLRDLMADDSEQMRVALARVRERVLRGPEVVITHWGPGGPYEVSES